MLTGRGSKLGSCIQTYRAVHLFFGQAQFWFSFPTLLYPPLCIYLGSLMLRSLSSIHCSHQPISRWRLCLLRDLDRLFQRWVCLFSAPCWIFWFDSHWVWSKHFPRYSMPSLKVDGEILDKTVRKYTVVTWFNRFNAMCAVWHMNRPGI